MAAANYPPTLIGRNIFNDNPVAIPLPIVAVGAAAPTVNIVKTAGDVDKILALGSGLWTLSYQGQVTFPVDATTCRIMNAIVQDADNNEIITATTVACGASGAMAANAVLPFGGFDQIFVPEGTTRTMRLAIRYTGTDRILTVTGGRLEATRVSQTPVYFNNL